MSLPRGRIVAVALGLAVVLAGGAGLLLAPRFQAAGPDEAHAEPEGSGAGPGPMYVLKERVVNLADPGARRYLKIALSLEFSMGAAEFRRASLEERRQKQAELEKSIAHWVPLIEDVVIALASTRTSGDLASPEGKALLKNDVRESINRRLGGEQVVNVYFTQFVMQ